MWSSVGTLLGQMRAAGCTEWALVTATLLRRADALRDLLRRRELHDAWASALAECARGAAARGDHAQARFLTSLLEEMEVEVEPN